MCGPSRLCYTSFIMKKYRLFSRANTLLGRAGQLAVMLLGIAALVWLAAHWGVYRCPLRWTFGVECPACGMTRAAAALLRFDFIGAFRFNPLVYVVCAYAAICAYGWLFRPRLLRSKRLWAVFIALFLCFWAVRIALFFLGQYPAFLEPNARFPVIFRKLFLLIKM